MRNRNSVAFSFCDQSHKILQIDQELGESAATDGTIRPARRHSFDTIRRIVRMFPDAIQFPDQHDPGPLIDALVHFLLIQTVFGGNLVAIGTSEQAAKMSGIDPRPYRLAIFSLSGLQAGLGGLFSVA